MLAFLNKCKRNNEELMKKIQDRKESKNGIEILDAIDTKYIFEMVDVDETDTKEFLDVDKTDTKELLEPKKLDEIDTKEFLEVVNEDESDTKETLNVNVDNPKLSLDSYVGESANNENLKKHVKNTSRYPKSRLEGTLACHICGKRYHNYKLRYHINMHEGRYR